MTFQAKPLLGYVGGVVLFFGGIVLVAVCLETGIKCFGEDYRKFNTFSGYDRCYVIDEDWKAIILIVIGSLGALALLAGGIALLVYLKRSREMYESDGKSHLFEFAVTGQQAKNALSVPTA